MSRSVRRTPRRQADDEEKPSSSRRVMLAAVALASFSLTIGAVFGDHGWLELRRYKHEHAQLTTEVQALERSIEDLESEIGSYDTDPEAVERIAREELGLGRPGEVIVFLPPGPPDDADPPVGADSEDDSLSP